MKYFPFIQFLEKKCSMLTPLKRITLFIDLFIGFQHELIKFPKTKPKSLIPHQCFLAQSDFKDLCSAFIEIFGDDNIKWDCNIKRVGVFIENGKKKYKYIKEKNRSQNLFNAFSNCLADIKSKLIKQNTNIGHSQHHFSSLLQKWSSAINKFKPKEYELSFRSNVKQQQPHQHPHPHQPPHPPPPPPPPPPVMNQQYNNHEITR